jgi:hypothetical protein
MFAAADCCSDDQSRLYHARKFTSLNDEATDFIAPRKTNIGLFQSAMPADDTLAARSHARISASLALRAATQKSRRFYWHALSPQSEVPIVEARSVRIVELGPPASFSLHPFKPTCIPETDAKSQNQTHCNNEHHSKISSARPDSLTRGRGQLSS